MWAPAGWPVLRTLLALQCSQRQAPAKWSTFRTSFPPSTLPRGGFSCQLLESSGEDLPGSKRQPVAPLTFQKCSRGSHSPPGAASCWDPSGGG